MLHGTGALFEELTHFLGGEIGFGFDPITILNDAAEIIHSPRLKHPQSEHHLAYLRLKFGRV